MSQIGGLLFKKGFQHSSSIHVTYYVEVNLGQSKIVWREKLLNGKWSYHFFQFNKIYFDDHTNYKWHNIKNFIETLSKNMLYHFQPRFHLNRNRAGKIRFSGDPNSVLLKTNSGARCVPCNFVLLVTLRRTSVSLTVYLTVHQMK